MAEPDVVLHLEPAQVQIPVLEPDIFVSFCAFDFEWRGLGGVQNMDFLSDHLDLPGFEVWVDLVLIARRYLAGDGSNVFAPQLASTLMGRGVFFFVADDLDQPLAVPKVDEDKRSEVAPAVDPSHQSHGLADVCDTKLATVVSSF